MFWREIIVSPHTNSIMMVDIICDPSRDIRGFLSERADIAKMSSIRKLCDH